MAHIQKRTRGGQIRWVARIPSPDGKERTKTFDRKVDAERWVTVQESTKQRGTWVDPRLGRVTFSEWVERWKATIVHLRPNTIDNHDVALRTHLLPRFGGVPIAKITTSDVKAFVADMQADGQHAAGTVRKAGQVLSRVLEGAIDEGLIARSPCHGVKLPADTPREMQFLDADEVRDLAAAIDPHYRVLVVTAAYLGLRWGELAGLRPDRVDLLRRRITVIEQLTETRGRLEFGPPKTPAARRSLSVPSFLTGLLEEQLGERATTGLVFPSQSGQPMRRSNFRRRVWVPACRQIGLGEKVENAATGLRRYQGLRFHDLRHTAVALAIARGAHPKAIQERLGHSSITVTLDRYGHLFPNLDEAIADALDETWREAGRRRDGDGTGRVAPVEQLGRAAEHPA